MKYSRLSCLP